MGLRTSVTGQRTPRECRNLDTKPAAHQGEPSHPRSSSAQLKPRQGALAPPRRDHRHALRERHVLPERSPPVHGWRRFAEDQRSYRRSDPRSRIFRFRRLRASASTCSFHRSLFHSGARELALESNGAGLRLVGDEAGEPRRSLGVAPPLGIGLNLGLGMAHLRAVRGSSDDRDRYVLIAAGGRLFTSSMPQSLGCAYGHRHPIAPRQPLLCTVSKGCPMSD